MPVAQSSGHAGKALLVAAVGVAVALGVVLAVAVLSTRGDVQLSFGDGIWEPGRADRLAADIERDGPQPYPPLVGDRPVYLQHLGDDPGEGWLAFGAFDPDDPSCLVEWSAQRELFVNRCDPSVTYPPDGEGLRHYETAVRDGRVRVDLLGRAVERTTTTAVVTGR